MVKARYQYMLANGHIRPVSRVQLPPLSARQYMAHTVLGFPVGTTAGWWTCPHSCWYLSSAWRDCKSAGEVDGLLPGEDVSVMEISRPSCRESALH